MRALVYDGPHDIHPDTVPDPELEATDGAIVRIERTAICGSDLHIYHGGMGPGPFTVGHEAIGEVVETGSGVRRFRSGDRVLVSGVIGCNTGCLPCRHGRVTSCEADGGRVFGTNQGLGGGQAEAMAVPVADANLCAIPEGVTDEQAVLLTDILPTGYFGASRADIAPGQDVAVIGCGPVGIMAILSARLFSPARIFALDSVPHRLKLAEQLGAIPCDVGDGANEKVLAATGGLGPNAVIEAVGADASIQNAFALVRRGGTVSVVGVNTNPSFDFNMMLAMVKTVTFRIGVVPVPAFWPNLVPLLQQGKLQPDLVFTHRMALSEGAQAYELFANRRDGVMKVLLDPGA